MSGKERIATVRQGKERKGKGITDFDMTQRDGVYE